MKPSRLFANSTSISRLAWVAAVFGGALLGASPTPTAQTGPPVGGTVALEGTMKKVYAAASTVIVTTIDGVEHVVHVTKDLLVHGGKSTGVDALQGLREGSTVVVHYTMKGGEASAQEIDGVGDGGLNVTEGVVTRVDRGRKEISIRFDDGKSETFRLTDRAVAEAGENVNPADSTRVTVYYSDDAGRKVAHFFKRTSS